MNTFQQVILRLTSGHGFGGLHPAYPISFDSIIANGVSATKQRIISNNIY